MNDISFAESLIKDGEFLHSKYIDKFYNYKKPGLSCRDVVWGFCNYVQNEYEREGYKLYQIAMMKNDSDRALMEYEVIQKLNFATLELEKMFSIAVRENKIDIALDLLTNICYRDIQNAYLSKELNVFHKTSKDDIVRNIKPKMIINFLEENNYTINDFKFVFLQNRHPYIISKLNNEETWIYIEEAIKRQLEWDKKR